MYTLVQRNDALKLDFKNSENKKQFLTFFEAQANAFDKRWMWFADHEQHTNIVGLTIFSPENGYLASNSTTYTPPTNHPETLEYADQLNMLLTYCNTYDLLPENMFSFSIVAVENKGERIFITRAVWNQFDFDVENTTLIKNN